MQLGYEQARNLKGKMIQYQNSNGEWTVGRVTKVRKDGLEIEELNPSNSSEGYGFGFWGPGPFFGPPVFVSFGVGVGFAPWLFW